MIGPGRLARPVQGDARAPEKVDPRKVTVPPEKGGLVEADGSDGERHPFEVGQARHGWIHSSRSLRMPAPETPPDRTSSMSASSLTPTNTARPLPGMTVRPHRHARGPQGPSSRGSAAPSGASTTRNDIMSTVRPAGHHQHKRTFDSKRARWQV